MSSRRRILTIIGTRPEVIKLAPVVREIERDSAHFESIVCITAQHRGMLDQALEPFDLRVDHDLDIMRPGQTLAEVTARAVVGLDQIIRGTRPDFVLVQGDTTTAFAGALAAYYQRVRVGHVEAGLRTGQKFAPYPEEVNRLMIARLADVHFAPTERARLALLAEGVPESAVRMTGNTVIDSLLWMREQVRRVQPELPVGLVEAMRGHTIVLVTGHRRESFGDGFENICVAIREVADRVPDSMFVYPVHLNPNVREPVVRILGGHKRIRLVEPLSYAPFVWLMDRATVVLTDSGGVQEEAPSMGKPVLVMRDATERPEGVAAGNARLVGANTEQIVAGLMSLLHSETERTAMSSVANPYGDGHSAERIVAALREML